MDKIRLPVAFLCAALASCGGSGGKTTQTGALSIFAPMAFAEELPQQFNIKYTISGKNFTRTVSTDEKSPAVISDLKYGQYTITAELYSAGNKIGESSMQAAVNSENSSVSIPVKFNKSTLLASVLLNSDYSLLSGNYSANIKTVSCDNSVTNYSGALSITATAKTLIFSYGQEKFAGDLSDSTGVLTSAGWTSTSDVVSGFYSVTTISTPDQSTIHMAILNSSSSQSGYCVSKITVIGIK